MMEKVSFQLNTVCFVASKHAKHTEIITWWHTNSSTLINNWLCSPHK